MAHEAKLRAQSGRLEHHPQLKACIDQHLEHTLGQQKTLAECIERLDGQESRGKDDVVWRKGCSNSSLPSGPLRVQTGREDVSLA
ncbi:hypothetical protein AWB77_06104 [Caballeronia fortuita]|uniref:Uncharacterized protein n=1 Tax=Caballeronia fortuita TaxID=1777138 RepID=A0A158E049_9BURK|nr:DUF892 family protein [Caballeronia fortuita]SAL00275.1 hypothetical protein AWB77_06104 [Caballeronia fortuita]